MKAYSAAVISALENGELPLVAFVRIAFPSGVVALNDSNWHFQWGGDLYKGAAALAGVSPITDGGGEPGGLVFELLEFSSAYIALALDDADEVQGSPIDIRCAILDKATYQIIDAPIVWRGYADTMQIGEDAKSGSIALTAENKGVDLLRGNPRVYSDGDQQAVWPGDRYYEYVNDQSDKPVIWPSREWFFKK